jgi:hypothetical protein
VESEGERDRVRSDLSLRWFGLLLCSRFLFLDPFCFGDGLGDLFGESRVLHRVWETTHMVEDPTLRGEDGERSERERQRETERGRERETKRETHLSSA